MSPGGRHFAWTALFVTGAFLLVAGGQRQNDQSTLEVQRGVRLARTLSWKAAQGDNEALQAFVSKLPQSQPLVTEALVLKGTKFLAHSTPERAGNTLDRESGSDKELYDRSARLKATVGKNDDERAQNPGLLREAYAEAEAQWFKSPDRLVVSVPVEDEGAFKGMASVTVSPARPWVPLPWTVLVLGLVFAVVFIPVGKKLTGLPLALAGALGLAALLAIDVSVLVGWRSNVRQTLAGEHATAVGRAFEAGLIDPASEDVAGQAASLSALLANDEFQSKQGDLESLAPGAPSGDGVFPAGSWSWRAPSTFDSDGRAKDRSSLLIWAIGLGLVAIGGYLLGIRGNLGAAWRALVEHRWAYAYLAPAMTGLLLLSFVPVTFGIVLGFMERRYNIFDFVGLANYVQILSDFNLKGQNNFYFTFGVTVMWTVMNVVLHVSIGLFLALMLNDQFLKARGFYRVILIIPWAIPNYITALIWKGMFHKQFGVVNAALAVFGVEPIAWFQDFWPAFSTNVVTNTWLGFPFMMVVSLGALQSIPADLYEAAWVDGANRWQRFRFVTLPLLMPALVPAVINGVVWTFNMFNIIYLVSGGAPDGKTDILITEAFRWAFERDRYGYAAAYSTLIFLILLSFTLVTNKVTGATKGAFE